MQISSATSSASPGALKGNKAALERKIKRLEKKRDELQQKLAGFGGSGGNDNGGVAQGNVTVGGQTIASQAPAGKMMVMGSGATAAPTQTSVSDSVSTQVGVMNQATGKAAPAAAMAAAQAPASSNEAGSVGEALQSMSQAIPSSGGGGGGEGVSDEEREAIQKQIESLNMLIVTLRSQLARMEDDGSIDPNMLEEPSEEGGTGPAEAIPLVSAESLPEVEVSADGSVDGYV